MSTLNKHKTIKTRSLKKYTAENFCAKLNDVNFPNYSEFVDVNNAFVDFSDKLMQAVDAIAPYRQTPKKIQKIKIGSRPQNL